MLSGGGLCFDVFFFIAPSRYGMWKGRRRPGRNRRFIRVPPKVGYGIAGPWEAHGISAGIVGWGGNRPERDPFLQVEAATRSIVY